MDENDFNEVKLRDLMQNFREKYVEPNMFIMLYSKVEQYNRSRAGHADIMFPRKNYTGGVLIYRGYDQVIRYIGGSERDWHTIVVQGVDPIK